MTNNQQALDHVAAVQAARHHLRDLYRRPERPPNLVAQLNAELGDAMRLAEVHATLAVSDQLERIANALEDRL